MESETGGEGEVPLLEFDPAPTALIEPSQVLQPRPVPARCVLCFFQDAISALATSGAARQVAVLRSEIGVNPIYEVDVDGEAVGVVHPGVGAPLAAGFLEELIALGGKAFVACGGAGVLDAAIALGHLVVPVSAVRDEGTSYHYLPPAREVPAHPAALEAITAALQATGIPYIEGKTWTTDAIYRETAGKVRRRRAEGCITVEMEAAALFAVARFRAVPLGQILYGGDDLSGDLWDHRGWDRACTVRERVLALAIEAARAIQFP